MNNKIPLEELKFCLNIWEEKEGCSLGGETRCEQCAAPYLLLKMIGGPILHDPNMKKLTLNDWKNQLKQYEN